MCDKNGNRDWFAMTIMVAPILGAILWSYISMNTRLAIVEMEVKHLQEAIRSQ